RGDRHRPSPRLLPCRRRHRPGSGGLTPREAEEVPVNVLERILERKRREVEARRAEEPEGRLRERAKEAPPPRGFLAALRKHPPSAWGVRVVAEFKRASPSR